MPIAYLYGEDVYIHDCVCNNALPDVVDGLLADILLRHKVQMSRFESNAAGGRTAEKINELVKAKHGITNITTKFTTANKETKIIVHSAYIKEHFYFRDSTIYSKMPEYKKMMNFLVSYTVAGKNKYDDVPDGLAMLSDFIQGLGGRKPQIFERPW